jgi:carboxymethylenebutenolidase
MKEFKVALSTSDGVMEVHGFGPENSSLGKLPAIIVMQEAFGVNAHVKNVCRRLAQLGYLAIAPELFHRAGAGLEFGYEDFSKVRPLLGTLTNSQLQEDLTATHQYLLQRPDVDVRKIAGWGFCLGGWAAMLAACELPLAAAISFYGGGMVNPRPGIGFTPLLDRFEKIRCPVLLVFGGQDKSIPAEDIQTVKSRLTELAKVFELEIYPEGGHGFFCEDRASYHRASAEAAWTRATQWLADKLALV